MKRRNFCTMAVAALVASSGVARATTQIPANGFLNGEINFVLRTFDWLNGGGDALHRNFRRDNFRKALAIERLNLTLQTQQGLRAVLATRGVRVNLKAVYEGKVVGDVMISGAGWIALKPRAVTSSWRHGRTTMATWWTWTNPANGERWEIIVADVCGNLILTRLGQAVPCTCGPNDACV